jgi:putative redox protein
LKAIVKLRDGVCFDATTESGHTITMDGAPEHGGLDRGSRPMELMLSGLGGCSAFDVVHILRKARQKVEGCVVELEAERHNEPPRVFTKIHLHFKVSGQNLSKSKVERAVHLSAEKYCSASIMLSKSVEITHDVEILDS